MLNNLDVKLRELRGQTSLGRIVRNLNDQAYFVTEFHEDLRSQLYSAADMFLGATGGKNMNYPSDWLSRETVCDVVVRMKPRFLVYAPFVEMCNNVAVSYTHLTLPTKA